MEKEKLRIIKNLEKFLFEIEKEEEWITKYRNSEEMNEFQKQNFSEPYYRKIKDKEREILSELKKANELEMERLDYNLELRPGVTLKINKYITFLNKKYLKVD
ncbi:MAG: hypothetical protein KKB62_01445 [Nanoarchaeota archaeon]|nr:hypothetical protein [Nanoarchaeota archaeon]